MNRIIKITGVITLLFLFAACGSKKVAVSKNAFEVSTDLKTEYVKDVEKEKIKAEVITRKDLSLTDFEAADGNNPVTIIETTIKDGNSIITKTEITNVKKGSLIATGEKTETKASKTKTKREAGKADINKEVSNEVIEKQKEKKGYIPAYLYLPAILSVLLFILIDLVSHKVKVPQNVLKGVKALMQSFF